MIVRTKTPNDTRRPNPIKPRPTLHRRAMCQFIAMALFGTGIAHAGTTPPAFSQAWFATKQPGARPPSAPSAGVDNGNHVSFTPGSALLQRRVQNSIQNLNNAAAALATQMQQQKDAQAAAAQRVSKVPDGLVEGGLKPAAGIAADPSLWQNAHAPTDTVAGGKHTVEVKQTAKKAILTWDSFNVGRDTTLYFNQSGGNLTGGGNDWIALNRVNDPSANPSQILGRMKAEGTVYLLNRNGIIFGQGAQVDTHSLLASSMYLFSKDLKTSNDTFLASGITDPTRINMPVFVTDAAVSSDNSVVVEKGASIDAGSEGVVILAAPQVIHRGSIVADDGEVVLASARQIANVGAAGALDLVVDPSAPSLAPLTGGVENSGLVQARRGSITMFGPHIAQDGVVVTSTSISRPGTISLQGARRGDITGPVEFGAGSVTAVLPEKDGTTTTSTSDADKVFVPGSITVTGSKVTLDGGSLIEAPGGTVALRAQATGGPTAQPNDGRVYIDSGATIDVSGLADVELPMSALLVSIPRIGQNELADSPLLRNSFLYTQKNILLDSTVSGTRADGLDWIGSPILNAAGYVQNMPRDIDQMLTRGGSITLDGNEVIARTGSRMALDGGYLAYQSGWITTPNLLGADGRIYNIASADPDVAYVGFAGQYTNSHARWGVSETYNSPVMGGTRRYQEGFVKGADAGKLTVHANIALALDGEMSAQATPGTQQTGSGTQPDGGSFAFDVATSSLGGRSNRGLRVQEVSRTLESLSPGFDKDTQWSDVDVAAGLDAPWMVIGADTLGKAGFSTLDLSANTIEETSGTRLVVQPGGSVSMSGGRIDIYGSIEAPSGHIAIAAGNLVPAPGQSSTSPPQDPDMTLHDGASLSARGQWVNDSGLDANHAQGGRWINGGNVTLTTYTAAVAPGSGDGGDRTGSIALEEGSVIDVSGGGYVDTRGRVSLDHGVPSGRGGNVAIETYSPNGASGVWNGGSPPLALDHGHIELDGTLRSWGFSGGGALTLRAAQIQVGGDPSDMALPNGLWLSPDFFSGQGFSRYNLDSVTDATVAEGTRVVVRPANMLGDIDRLRVLPTGADLYDTPAVTGVGFLDDWQRWATRGTSADQTPGLTVRAGEYLNWVALNPGSPPQAPDIPGVSGSARIGTGAVVDVDAGGLIDILARHNVEVDGNLVAHGGAINLSTTRPTADGGLTSRIRVGSHAVLDASGVALVDPQAVPANGPAGRTVPRVGDVLAGGSVALNGSYETFVIADDGARIDVSGAADTFDLPGASRRLNGVTADVVPTAVWSDAGSIVFGASAGLYIGATLDAHGGAPSAEGGSLKIVALDGDDDSAKVRPTGILVRQSQDGKPAFAGDDAIDGGVFGADGTIEFAADVLDGSGISTLQFGPPADETPAGQRILPLAFAGDVNLNLGRQVLVNASGIEALPANATGIGMPTGYGQGAGHVGIAAPYVQIVGSAAKPAAVAGDGILDVNAANIDMGGMIDLQGWRQARFNASDDIRFTFPSLFAGGDGSKVVPGMLFSTGDLVFSAGQVYPTSGYRFAIDANASGLPDAAGNARETTVTFLPSGHAPATPLSAGGALLVSADHIEQQGTIRVPSGTLVLGTTDPTASATDFGLTAGLPALANTKSVHLAPGSVTSVSLDGLTVPYGNTVDGVEWHYALRTNTAAPLIDAPPAKQVDIQGDAVALDAGATIDLDGGGGLQAAEFVPGTGGTRDLLATAPNGAAVYAILPGYHGAIAPNDLAMDANGVAQPGVGRQVYLSGVPGLSAGYYTLLPAQYATLPGAMRIYQTTSRDAVVGRAATFADGGYAVGGYYGDALTGAHDARTTTFVVQSADTWQQYSQYRLTDADTFFHAAAGKKGQVAPPLAADAGRLQIGAGHRLDLGATLDATPDDGGRTSQVDIAGQAIQILGGGDTARDGYLGISADGLTTLGAGSLLLGGTRRSDTDGDHVDVTADAVLLSNDAAHPLAGQEILLVAGADGDGITLENGSVLAARGNGNPVASQPLVFGRDAGNDAGGKPVSAIDGNGAMLRVSQNDPASISRFGLGNGSPGGMLTIDAGATVAGGNALSLDGTGLVRVDDNALLSGRHIDATANRIAFVGADATAPSDGLAIGAATLAQWRGSDSVTLRSRGNIDFLGAQDVAVDNSLVLSAGALAGDGHDVNLHAGTVTFANLLGATAGDALAGGGVFHVDANEIDFGQGKAMLRGFGAFDGSATSGIVAAAQGGMDFGAASVNLSAPVFVADGGAATTLVTTGSLGLHGTEGTALSRDGLGGSLTLRAASIDDSMNLKAAAGGLTLDATQGGIRVDAGATLDVGGVTRQFFDTAAYAPGGNLVLSAIGDIAIDDGANVRYGGAAEAGDAGSFKAVAGGALSLGGSYDGHAADGYRGGYFTIGTGGALDLDTLAGRVAASGSTGLVDITSGEGDLALSAGHTLTANKVYLYANGGKARIDGTVDASSPAGSRIEVWARQGVDINGTLDAHVTTPEQRGGDVLLGTTGTGNGGTDPTYGYEEVDRADAGYVHVGAGARIDVSGGANTAFAGGKLSIRAPLLADGDVPVTIDNPGSITGARDVTVEPFAVWSTKDGTSNQQYFDGVIDPAGWFEKDGVTMVAGTWTDGKGNVLPPPTDAAQQADYLDQYYFTPDAINLDHAGFYGYRDGDPTHGPGTLMGFVQQPGFTFGDRFAGIANVHVRPGIELRNPVDGGNDGDIEVVTHWNLGAGVTGADGKPQLAYRYNGEAPILTVRAGGNLDLKASITDGFYQSNDGAQLNDPPSDAPDDPQYDAALAEYQAAQAFLDANNAWNGTINLADGDPGEFKTPGGGTADISKDPYYQPLTAPSKGQDDDYYVNYQQYITEFGDNNTNFGWSSLFVSQNALGFLAYHPTTQQAPQPASFATYDDYVSAYADWLANTFPLFVPAGETPSPILLPIASDYSAWSRDYTRYISGHFDYYNLAQFIGDGLNSQLFYAPFAPRESNPVNPVNPLYTAALTAYQKAQLFLDANGAWNGTINLASGDPGEFKTPGGGTADITKDPYYQPLTAPLQKQTDDYYNNYQKYIVEFGDNETNFGWSTTFVAQNSLGFLTYNPTTQQAPQPASFATYDDYANAYADWLGNTFPLFVPTGETPSPILLPIASDYSDWSRDYTRYISGHFDYYNLAQFIGDGLNSQLFYAPFAPREQADATPPPAVSYGKPAANNSPSNMPSYGNAASLASATLLGGPSTSYRFVAGADTGAADPLSTLAASAANVRLDGHFAVKDTVTDPTIVTPNGPFSGKTLYMPTTIRTGTGDIDMVSAGDIQWLDAAAPATIYTAGAPAEGTTAGTESDVLRPAEDLSGKYDNQPDMLVNGLVNPDHAGDIHLHAGGDITAIQGVVDADGSQTKSNPGTSVAQYWWQWMQVGNAADGSRSSIDFANFRQGVMSVGGNVDVDAGGDISELSVSLPTTWYKNTDGKSIATVGGGDLSVHAGGDILSGTYFVAKGTMDVRADGAIAVSPSLANVDTGVSSGSAGGDVTTPVSTLFGLQDTQATVSARQGADIGGVYDPSYYGVLSPAGHPDSQGYSTASSFDAASVAGDVVFGSLLAPGRVFGGAFDTGAGDTGAGVLLAANIALAAMGGSIDIRTNGQLFPSPEGNLTLLAADSIGLTASNVLLTSRFFGLIDSSPNDMPSPLKPLMSGGNWLGADEKSAATNASFHEPDALHADDTTPVRIYAADGDITSGLTDASGITWNALVLLPSKQADIRAGRDIVNLSLIGQHTRASDITRVSAGRDIYDTAYPNAANVSGLYSWWSNKVPALLVGGPGTFVVDAGRDVGPFVSQADLTLKPRDPSLNATPTGIQAVGNFYNPYLPHESADILVNFGIAPGVNTAGFIAHYLDGTDGLPGLMPDLVQFMQQRIAGKATATGHLGDEVAVALTPEQARDLFDKEPDIVQRLFAEKVLFKLLAQVGTDYQDASSPYAGQYARGYEALANLFPAAWGYTSNGTGQGGLNGAAATVGTGDLDIRSSTIQTQQGGDVTLLGPGGQALIGSTSAPSKFVNSQGRVVAGPNSMGLLTLEQGNVNVFADRSLLLAQSRVFTEQGGDVTIWSSNGDINAGQGAKTSSEIPPPTFLCDVDAWCRVDARGQVSGAGIATLQTVEGAAAGNAYLIAPRGTVDAGDAGIRVAGNLVIAAARVANADNIQVKGEAIGVPVTAAVNVGALNAASAAATAASQAAEDVARKQQADARDRLPSEISVRVLRDGDTTSSASPAAGYDGSSPIRVLGPGDASRQLTDAERKALRRM
ncbi:filamentous haemagglutinin family protein [Luteibacter yeojuensis]|uniref:Filamentous hemagglutinin N-terminal domain-containing protein n=1 Tax=Luteibacter yeojuensis TaxID=345309 RepID=A0A7X5QT80_9GAMM|nr:filamentous haemagglutinin family protein [Luteibacter yeojuensis]NID14909.1 filamentous hemagglutinin N-terminal domain-containing protein [Luteibacter yeojuensis]